MIQQMEKKVNLLIEESAVASAEGNYQMVRTCVYMHVCTCVYMHVCTYMCVHILSYRCCDDVEYMCVSMCSCI